MRGFALLALLLAPGAAEAEENWKPLFNGRNLDGWQHVGPGEVVVENGVLKTVGGMGLLWYTREKIGNAVIKIVYRAPDDNDGGNSGVFIRIPEKPTEPWMPVNRGYEVQIDDSDDDWHRTGVLYSFTKTLALGILIAGDQTDRAGTESQPLVLVRILIAEDDSTMRHFLTMALQRAGHDVEACDDGLSALQTLEQPARQYHQRWCCPDCRKGF